MYKIPDAHSETVDQSGFRLFQHEVALMRRRRRLPMCKSSDHPSSASLPRLRSRDDLNSYGLMDLPLAGKGDKGTIDSSDDALSCPTRKLCYCASSSAEGVCSALCPLIQYRHLGASYRFRCLGRLMTNGGYSNR